jgi:ATP/maltotriose-dependent transcriptional regulator MalT
MTVADVTLTKRQREVVQLLLDGATVGEIALRLMCEPTTVRKHIASIAETLPGPHPPMRRILVYGAALLAEAG